jgi:hypothetical protein
MAYRSNRNADFVAASAMPGEEGSHTRTCSLDPGEVHLVYTGRRRSRDLLPVPADATAPAAFSACSNRR